MMTQKSALSFDRVVWLSVATVIVTIALVILRGDQLQLLPQRLSPVADAVGVSPRTQIVLQFDQPLAALPPGATLQLTPPVTGALQIAADRLIFTPGMPLTTDMTYTVQLDAALRGQQGGRLREPLRWQFRTGGLQVVYTAVDAEGRERLFVADANLGGAAERPASPTQLTSGPLSLWDFSVSPRSGQIVYSALKEDGTSDLWAVQLGDLTPTLLAPCPNAVCNSTAWSPDGKLLAYARRNASEFGAAALSPPRLWLFDPASGDTAPVFTDSQKLAFEPSWSADNQWLSYVSPEDGGVGVIQLATGQEQFYPTISGETGRWQPQADRLLYTSFRQVGEQYVAHIVLADPVSGEATNLSGETALVEDGAPAWSPDGAWIAFRRKELTGPGATPGKQIWRMRADGRAAAPLTSDPGFDYSAPQWSPDGRYLLFHRLPLKGPTITLSVWIYDVTTGARWLVAEPGQRPQWAP
ncbi:MAG: PD40 domain-containing protein [Caldilineaceae bacterium]|nr:PD40 domain-containing protein [Caldilineaceae bacterium]